MGYVRVKISVRDYELVVIRVRLEIGLLYG